MPDELSAEFLKYSQDKLEQLTGRIESCLDRLTPEQIWTRGSDSQNAIGNLVLHLSGNVRQWILHGVGGEPDHRARDAEFAARDVVAMEDLKRSLRDAVESVNGLLATLNSRHLLEQMTIQSYDVSKLAGIYHVVEHFSYHTGQIIFATKWLTGEDMGFYRHLTNKAHGETVP